MPGCAAAVIVGIGCEDADAGFNSYDVEHADSRLFRALITYCVRHDCFCAGALENYAQSDFLNRRLARLEKLDKD